MNLAFRWSAFVPALALLVFAAAMTPAAAADETPPTITGVHAITSSGTYGLRASFLVRVTFSEPVFVTSTPLLTLETGATDRDAIYESGSGTTQLFFRYTAQFGDTSSDLDYVSSSALSPNGGTIRDAAGNDATLTLPTPGASGSLGGNESLVIQAGAGSVDGAFNPNANYSVWTVAVQPGGNVVLSGGFSAVGGFSRRVVRVRPDGSVDTSFDVGNTGSAAQAVAVQPDGKIVFGGDFGGFAGAARSRLARTDAEGNLDTGFNPGADGTVSALLVQPDGKIVVAGTFTTAGGAARNRIARLNSDGSVDAAFNPNADDRVHSLALQEDGKILVGGSFNTIGGTARSRVARLNADGSVDVGFNPGANGVVMSIAVQPDGKILLGGQFTAVGGATRNRIARLDPDGSLDAAFDPNLNDELSSLALQADGKILIGGNFSSVGGTARNRVARLNADGGVDPSFNPHANYMIYGLMLQADGEVLIGGAFTSVGGMGRNYMARLANDPATLSLAVTSGSRVEWLRGGSAPEVSQVSFDVSTDSGGSWTPLGTGTRITGGWELTGLTLPASGWVRARGRAAGGYRSSSSGIVEHVRIFPTSAPTDLALSANSVDQTAALAGTTIGTLTTTDSNPGDTHTFAFATGEGDDHNGFFVLDGATLKIAGSALPTGDYSIRLRSTDTQDETVEKTLTITVAGPRIAAVHGITAAGTKTGGDNFLVRVSFDEPVTVTGTPLLTLETGEIDRVAPFESSDGAYAFFRYTVRPGDTSPDLDYASTAALALNGGTISDADGNDAWLRLPVPGASGSLAANEAIVIAAAPNTAPTDIAVSATSVNQSAATAGATVGTLATTDPDAGDAHTYAFVSGEGATHNGSFVIDGTTLKIGGASLGSGSYSVRVRTVDAQGSLFDKILNVSVVDDVLPVVSAVHGITTAGTYKTGASFLIRVSFSEAVFVTGTPALTLETGDVDRVIAYESGSDSALLLFRYTVQSGDLSSDLDYASTGALALGDGTIRDSAGNDAVLTLPVPGGAGSLAANAAIVIDAVNNTAPTDIALSVSSIGRASAIAGATIATLTTVDADAGDTHSYVFVAGEGDTHNGSFALDGTTLKVGASALAPGSYSLRIQTTDAAGAAFEKAIAVVVLAAGALDAGFNPNAGHTVRSFAVQPDGKILVGGQFSTMSGSSRRGIARLHSDGSLDTGIDSSIISTSFGYVSSLTAQAEGNILIGGAFFVYGGGSAYRYGMGRVNTSGALDNSFSAGTNGRAVYAVIAQPDGKILFGGAFTGVSPISGASFTVRNRLVRFNADHSLDTGFDPNANAAVYSVALQDDGKILVGGDFDTIGGTARLRLARLESDGSLDNDFNPGGADGSVQAIVVQPNGKILLGGAFFTVGGTPRKRIARLDTDGTLDEHFNPDANGDIHSMALQADGKILIGGGFTSVGGVPRNRVARLHPDGSVDLSFDANVNSTVYGLTLQADGQILVGGQFTSIGGTTRNRIARLDNTAPTQTLAATSASRIEWLRGGTAPEVSPVTFELSTDDGATWTSLGAGTRIDGGWELTGLSLPAAGSVRARGWTAGGIYNSSSGLVEQVHAFQLNAAPTDVALSTALIDLSLATADAAVGTLATTDPDAGDAHTYLLVAGDGDTDNGSFILDDAALKIGGSALAAGSYSVRIRATDSGGLTFDKTFAISVSDQAAPPTDLTLSALRIHENMAVARTAIGHLSTADLTLGDTHTYSLAAGEGDTHNSSFAIDGEALLIAVPSLAVGDYSVRLRTTDLVGNTYEKALTLAVSDTFQTDAGFNRANPSHSYPTNTGMYSIVAWEPAIGERGEGIYTIELEITAGGYWPGQLGFTYGVAGYPMTDGSPHELGAFAGEWAFRGRSGDSVAQGAVATFGTFFQNVGDRIRLELDTRTGTLNVYTKRVGATEFGWEGGRPLATDVTPPEGKTLHFAVAGIAWQPASFIVVSETFPNSAPTDLTLSAATIGQPAATAGATVGTLATSDPDTGDAHTYAFVAGAGDTDNGSFVIDGTTLKVGAFELGAGTYSVRVRTTDAGGHTFDDILAITVDAPPRVASIVRQSPSTSPTDANTLVWRVTFSEPVARVDADDFTASGTTAAVTNVASADANAYDVTVSGGDLANLNGTVTLGFSGGRNIQDAAGNPLADAMPTGINDNTYLLANNAAPVFTAFGPFSVAETSVAGDAVGDIDATDGDGGAADVSLSFTIVGGTGQTLFAINSSTGALTVNAAGAAELDYESLTSYTLTIRADDGQSANNTTDRSITINITDTAPEVPAGQSFSIAENSLSTTIIGGLPLSGDTDSVTWSILAGNMGDAFAIDDATGHITVANSSALNFEAAPSFTLAVRATDGTTNSDQSVAINLTNVNESPNVTSGGSVSFAENATGTVYTATGTDPDASTTLTFALGGADAALFDINANTGVITFVTSPNFEVLADADADNVYDLTVAASDAALTSAARAVAIAVTDENDAPTDIVLSAATLNQSQSANTIVGTLTTTDEDEGDTFAYALVSGSGSDDNASFNIAEDQLRANDPSSLAPGSFSVRVRTIDASESTIEKSFTILVSDDVSPAVLSIVSPAAGTYEIGQSMEFGVEFTEPVSVSTANGSPTLALKIGVNAREAALVSGSGTNTLMFHYVVLGGDYAADGEVVVASLALIESAIKDLNGNAASLTFASEAMPDVLVEARFHSADTDRNWRLSLLELTRVIELYNTRDGTTRTGAYHTDATTEDGFAAGTGTIASHHSADTSQDGKINLLELTRVIELYNTRDGTVRTGAYHRSGTATEDGFAPGTAN